MRRVLFVCTGNICRSASAELLLRHWAAQRGLAVEVRSAGIAAEGWYEVPEHAKKLLALEGVPPFTHKPQLLTREQLRWADVVLAMAGNHYDYISELYPEFIGKTRLLRDEDVADPMGKSYEVFAASLATIKDALEAFIRAELSVPRP